MSDYALKSKPHIFLGRVIEIKKYNKGMHYNHKIKKYNKLSTAYWENSSESCSYDRSCGRDCSDCMND